MVREEEESTWQKTQVKVGASVLSIMSCQNSSNSKRKIGMAESQFGFLKYLNGVWSLK